MLVIARKVDQWIVIGGGMLVGVTDIDPSIVRIIAQGKMIGGPEDGGNFRSVHELSVGQSTQLGPMVTIAIVAIEGDRVRIGVNRPRHMSLHRKEVADAVQHDEEGDQP